MQKAVTYLILVFCACSQGLVGQVQAFANGPQISGMLQIGLPQNEFAEAFVGNPTGVAGSLTFPVGKMKIIHFGGEYGWNSMGKEKFQVELDESLGQVTAGEMSVKSSAKSYHATMRFSPFAGPFRIYFDVFFGMRVYDTTTELLIEEPDGTEMLTSQKLSNQSTNSYGFAGGFMIALSRNLFFDAKIQSLQGGSVRYVDQSSLEVTNNGNVDFEIISTPTDIVIPQVGLSIVF